MGVLPMMRIVVAVVLGAAGCGRDMKKYCGEAYDSAVFVITRDQQQQFGATCPTMDEAAIQCSLAARDVIEQARCVMGSSVTVRPGGAADPTIAALCEKAVPHVVELTRTTLENQRTAFVGACAQGDEEMAKCIKHAMTTEALQDCMP